MDGLLIEIKAIPEGRNLVKLRGMLFSNEGDTVFDFADTYATLDFGLSAVQKFFDTFCGEYRRMEAARVEKFIPKR